jgi:alpha-tubulin suppressor-like RCC1 family protein
MSGRTVRVLWLSMSLAVLAAPQSARADVVPGDPLAWGNNTRGELGDFTFVSRITPGPVLDMGGVTAIAAGRRHNLALAWDGAVFGWGLNDTGQLGDGTRFNYRSTPALVVGPGGSGVLTDVVAVAAGYAHSVALKADGTVWTWGYNYWGQLGDGTTTERLAPVPVLGPGGTGILTGITAIAAGDGHTVALASDSTVWAWGWNSRGQLGDNTTTDRRAPVQVKDVAGTGVFGLVVGIGAGASHTLAIRASGGVVYAWGDNGAGQLGDGTRFSRRLPVRLNLYGVRAVAGGSGHSVALTQDGAVWAWGDNQYGQLGNGPATGTCLCSASPVPVGGYGIYAGPLNSVVAIAAGRFHNVAVRADGRPWTWGANWAGQLGDGTTTTRTGALPVKGPGGTGWLSGITAAAAGYGHTVALATPTIAASPARVARGGWLTVAWSGIASPGAGDWLALSTPGSDDTSFLDWMFVSCSKSPGPARAAGSCLFQVPPTAREGTYELRFFVRDSYIRLATSEAIVVAPPGPVSAWGANGAGQLGDGTRTNRSVPVAVAGIPDAVAVAAGANHSLALRSDGTVWAWGSNGFGQLGDGTTASRTIPVQVVGPGGAGVLTDVAAIAAGGYHSLALKKNGTLLTWGWNNVGQLGDGSLNSRSVPGPVLGLTGVTAIGAGGLHSLAVKSNGTGWAWGWNDFGQLGFGATVEQTFPKQFDLADVVALAAGSGHSVARNANGTVWGWGLNTSGQVGDDTRTTRTRPVAVKTRDGEFLIALGIAAAGGHSLAFDAEGDRYGWGGNDWHQLDLPDGLTSSDVATVTSIRGVVAVGAGGFHSLAATARGPLVAAGRNDSGQQGDGTISSHLYPVEVLGLTDGLAVAGGDNHSLAIATRVLVKPIRPPDPILVK